MDSSIRHSLTSSICIKIRVGTVALGMRSYVRLRSGSREKLGVIVRRGGDYSLRVGCLVDCKFYL